MKIGWVLATLAVTAGCSGTVDTSNDIEYEAKDACHHYVEQRLKAPGTADYSDEQVSGSGNTWTCSGTVDSENSFGGQVRNTFTVQVEKRSDGRWYVVSLTGLSN